MFLQFILVTLYIGPFLLQKLIDCLAKLRMGNPVGRPCHGWQKSPAQLVLALGAGVKALQLVGDTVIDALVVAAFEV